MNKTVTIILALFSLTLMQAQDINDALRYSMDNITGSARYRALSGAFGALGGDLSSLNVNPAGSAVINNNQAVVSLSLFDNSNKSTYFGTQNKKNDAGIDFNQLGGVLVFKNKNSNWNRITLAANYENTNNLDNSTFTSGTNPTTSIDQYFLYFANGRSLGSITNNSYSNMSYATQQAFFGYEGYIISPVINNNSNTQYVSEIPSGGNYYQENFVVSNGSNGKLTFNLAGQYKDKLYLGLNLNSHFTDYTRTTSFYESNTNDLNDGVQNLQFDNQLYTYGSGFSFQVGGIYKASQNLRLGLSYESPTWHKLNDEFTQRLSVTSKVAGETFNDLVDPQVINIYPTYKLQTPSKWTTSLAYVFDKKGFISFDYTVKDYRDTRFKPENDSFFSTLNSNMNAVLTTTTEYRLGVEIKEKEWSFRGGYRFEESPYSDQKTIGDLKGFSGGIGYNFGDTRLDISHSITKRDFNQGFFNQGLTSPAFISNTNNTTTISLLFEL